MQQFYLQALQLEARLLIDCLVKEIILYDDKIEIKLNSPLPPAPWKPTKDYFAKTEKEHDESENGLKRNYLYPSTFPTIYPFMQNYNHTETDGTVICFNLR